MHHEFITAVTARAAADERLRAAWLEGSFGRGNADRYSDLDIHLLLADDAIEAFRDGAEAWLGEIAPLVLYSLLFDGRMINALTADGLRLDVWLHASDTVALDPQRARVLYADAPERVTFAELPRPSDPSQGAQALARQLGEFWRCVALLPTVIGRGELIVSVQGLGIEVSVLSEILLLGYGVQRERGVKNLNPYLPPEARGDIERALALNTFTPASLAAAHLALAGVARRHGPVVAARHGIVYPAALEAAVLRYVRAELELMGIAAADAG